MHSSDEEDIVLTTEFMKERAADIVENLLPNKSRLVYIKTYDEFCKWKNENQASGTFSESVFLTYFNELSKKRKSSTLWSIYSMLQCTVKTRHNIDIKTYSNLQAYLKRLSEGYKPKKSLVFTAPNVERFLNEAPDSQFLAVKVALILGISGACRSNELFKLTVDDVQTISDTALLITLKDTKTKIDRTFVVRDDYMKIVEKYQSFRPPNTNNNRFFLFYSKNKCTKNPIGINKIGSMPKDIATFLKLPNPEMYTGHSLRRTSATLLANTGADMTELKRHGGWKSTTVAEGYIEDCIENKSKRSLQIASSINLKKPEDPWTPRPSTSKDAPEFPPAESSDHRQEINIVSQVDHSNDNNKKITLNFSHCSNFNVHFN